MSLPQTLPTNPRSCTLAAVAVLTAIAENDDATYAWREPDSAPRVAETAHDLPPATCNA